MINRKHYGESNVFPEFIAALTAELRWLKWLWHCSFDSYSKQNFAGLRFGIANFRKRILKEIGSFSAIRNGIYE